MSESGSSDGDDQKDVPGLLPLSNGFLPPNFAALLASATGKQSFISSFNSTLQCVDCSKGRVYVYVVCGGVNWYDSH